MSLAGLILGALIGLAVASVTAATIGELVVNAMWLDLNFPFFHKSGGDCALVCNTALTACLCSGLSFVLFVAAAVLYVVVHKESARFVALGGVAFFIGVFVCAVILYAKVPPRGETGERTSSDMFCDWSALSPTDLADWAKRKESRLKGYGNGAEQVYHERTIPVDGWLASMVWSVIALVLLIVILVLVIVKFPGIYEILQRYPPVEGDV
jgi:ABC-type antimicrobial peptide transport system permease subunit